MALSVALLALACAGMARGEGLPSGSECAEGAEPVTLGEHLGSAGVCVAADGEVVLLASGNVLIPCGTVIVAGTAAAEADPDDCDSLLELPPDSLEYEVVFPSDYATSSRRYPVLYLLTAGGQDEWPSVDPALQEIADRGLILVLPARGFGFYTDWHSGEHHFERLYTRELIADVDARHRTVANRTHRAVAGFSKAGYGAMTFAARNPDLYGAAASFSGLVDIAMPGFPLYFSAQMAPGFSTYDDPGAALDNPIWGNPLSHELGWHAKNPTDLAGNLEAVSLHFSSGDGTPTAEELASADPFLAMGAHSEAVIRVQNDNFDRALTAAGIPHAYDRHAGTHSYHHVVPRLHAWIDTLLDVVEDPVERPDAWDHRSADALFAVWGWRFGADRARAPEFLDVEDASAAGVTLRGSGTTTVETAPLFDANRTVLVTDETGRVQTRRSDSHGRLTFTADLGPAHTVKQYTAEGRALAARPGYFTTREYRFAQQPAQVRCPGGVLTCRGA